MDSENFVPPSPEPQSGAPSQPQSSNERNSGPRQGQPHGRRRGRRHRRHRGRRNGHQPQPREARHERQPAHSHGGVFTAPMDHSYRQQAGNQEVNGNTTGNIRGRNQRRGRGSWGRPEPVGLPPAALGSQIEPVPVNGDSSTRIFAFVDDLFFVTKMNETARKLNVRLEFVKTFEELLEKTNGDKPSLIIVDLNSLSGRPLAVIPKLKSQFKKGTSILGFVSHVQGDLKLKAQEAGCDVVMPRSAFSQNLPQLLRRHGAPEGISEF